MEFVINSYSIIALLIGLLLGFLLNLYLVLILGIIAIVIFVGICFSSHSAEGDLGALFLLGIDALFTIGLFFGVAPSLPWNEWFHLFGMAHAYLSEFFKSYVFR